MEPSWTVSWIQVTSVKGQLETWGLWEPRDVPVWGLDVAPPSDPGEDFVTLFPSSTQNIAPLPGSQMMWLRLLALAVPDMICDPAWPTCLSRLLATYRQLSGQGPGPTLDLVAACQELWFKWWGFCHVVLSSCDFAYTVSCICVWPRVFVLSLSEFGSYHNYSHLFSIQPLISLSIHTLLCKVLLCILSINSEHLHFLVLTPFLVSHFSLTDYSSFNVLTLMYSDSCYGLEWWLLDSP